MSLPARRGPNRCAAHRGPAGGRPAFDPNRRAGFAGALSWWGLSSLSGLGACSLTPNLAAPRAGQWQPLSPGLAWVPGAWGDVDPANQGRVGNVGVIVGPKACIVVNAGVSQAHGEALRTTIEQATGRPIGLLLLTHVRQEFVLGACAFQAAGIPVAMHPMAARLMAARCGTCQKRLAETLGAEAMAGTRVVVPDLLVQPGEPGFAKRLSDLAGRPLQWLAAGPAAHSSGPGDSALWDPTEHALVAGGWVDVAVVPDIQDGHPAGWRDALTVAQRLQPGHILPAHGPVAGPEALEAMRGYLDALDEETGRLLRAGVPLSEVADQAQLPAYRHWLQYDTVHRRNASISFLRQERAQLMGEVAPS